MSSGRARAFARNSCVTSSSCAGSPAPVSWIQNSKPPVVPMPGIGGGATGSTIAAFDRLRLGVDMRSSTARAFCVRAVSVDA